MADLRVFLTRCCKFRFIGLNHSPEYEWICRHCGNGYLGEMERTTAAGECGDTGHSCPDCGPSYIDDSVAD